MMYIVKSVVCDYGVYEKTGNEEKLIEICNSLSNAELIADILNTDLKNIKYDAIKASKVDKAKKQITDSMNEHLSSDGTPIDEYAYCYLNALEILEENIGE